MEDKMKAFTMSVLKSPILHFVLLGFVAFFLYVNLKPADRETIHVTTQTIDALVQQRESIAQDPVTPEVRREIIEGHIEEEVLLREAYKRGFDKNDYRVRKRLLGVMRTSLSEVIPEPSMAQLRAYYDESRDRYKTSPSVSFEHVYFAFTSKNLPANPDEFLKVLNKSDNALDLGELSMMGNRFNKSSFRSIASTFGKPFAEKVFELPVNTWAGPIESFLGMHYVRVRAHHEPELPPFENMESYLRQDYLLQKMRDSQQRKIDDMRRNYEIIVEGSEAKE